MKLAQKVIEAHSIKEELSQEVQDKIKANNDKMTELKKNGGSQEEIDALEAENDKLNGGNKTSEDLTEDSAIPAKFEIAMSKLDVKLAAKQADILKYAIRQLVMIVSDKPANKADLKAFAANLLSSVQHGVADIGDGVNAEIPEDLKTDYVKDSSDPEGEELDFGTKSESMALKVLKAHGIKEAKMTAKKAGKIVNDLYSKNGHGVQVSIMDLGKISGPAEKILMDGGSEEDAEKAVKDGIEKYRKN